MQEQEESFLEAVGAGLALIAMVAVIWFAVIGAWAVFLPRAGGAV